MKRLVTSYLTIALLLAAGLAAGARAQQKNQPASGQRVAAGATAAPVRLTLPNKDGSLRFLVIGDTGTGTEQQQQLADVMVAYRKAFPYEFVLMMGDNMYGGEKAADFKTKFENIYRVLLNDKVKFYAALGNHDESNQRFYEQFNMNGEEYYRFKKGGVSFYSLNSNYMDKRQLTWLE